MEPESDKNLDCHICQSTSYVLPQDCDAGDNLGHCDDCTYYTCEHCDFSTHDINDFHFQDDCFLCDDCYDRFCPACYHCSERISYRDVHFSDCEDAYCVNCYDELFTSCESCDCEVYIENSRNGRCEGCQQNGHDYSYKPTPKFHGKGNVYMGVELEVDHGSSVESLVSRLTDLDPNEDDFYMKHDGSLDDGIEIVSHPATIRAHMKDMRWKQILSLAKTEGFKSHDAGTCGLHVHVGRSGLGKSNKEIERTIDKLIVIFWKLDDDLFRFSRRSHDGMSHWSPFNHEMAYFRPTKADAAKSPERNRAINTTNYDTIEFRLFRGTLRLETFNATLQLVDTLVHLAQDYSLAHIIHHLKWSDVVDYNKNYSALRNYSKERNLVCA